MLISPLNWIPTAITVSYVTAREPMIAQLTSQCVELQKVGNWWPQFAQNSYHTCTKTKEPNAPRMFVYSSLFHRRPVRDSTANFSKALEICTPFFWTVTVYCREAPDCWVSQTYFEKASQSSRYIRPPTLKVYYAASLKFVASSPLLQQFFWQRPNLFRLRGQWQLSCVRWSCLENAGCCNV